MPNQEHPAWQAALDANTTATDQLGGAVVDLVGQLREQNRQRRTDLFRSVVIIVAAVLFVGAVLATISLGNRSLSRTLTDCTTPAPDHACYVRQQNATEKAIDEIVTRTITAICVGFHPQDVTAAARCVDRALREGP